MLSDPEGGGSLTRVEPDGTVELGDAAGDLRAVVRWHHDCMEWCPSTPVQEDMWWEGKKTPFSFPIVPMKTIHLPRQARDKHQDD